jgi:Spy/CpxP family protein refolding chaperone
MICLALGLGALGFVALRKARHCRHGYYGCSGYDGHGGPYGWGGPPWGGSGGSRWGGPPWARRGGFGRRGLYMALAHIDASPAQERAIIAEVEKLRERMQTARGGLKDARGDLAAAIRGSVLDDAALGAVLGRLDGATGEARAAMLEAVRSIHAVLDDKQRERLADLLDHGWWRSRGGGGPYRV